VLSLTTLSKFLTSHSLSVCCHPRNCRAAAATCCPRSRPQSTPPPWPRPRSMLLPYSSSSSWSLSRYHCRPRLHLPRSVPLPSTSTSPPSERVVAIVLNPNLHRYQSLTCLWLFVQNLWLFVTVCANLNVNELSWKIFAPLCDCLCECEWNLNMFYRIFWMELEYVL
jgi:hypothetical protein